ncbi:MAG: heme lyase CcmF/NrfE family subunit [Alphaproteobacteria bacterium]|nr:heme lyase CcmF/NrfE family subunit [Alphaproteobacteria bacterium]
MIIEAGHFALALSLIVALIQSVVPLWGARVDRAGWMMLGRRAAGSCFGLLAVAFFALVHAYALSDFSVINVVENSHTMMPVIYRLSAAWGNHEGSMLLWVLLLSFWGYVMARGSLPPAFQARALSFHGMIVAGFILFVLFASNPFLRIMPPAAEGLGLNPILQDIALALHPPLLYMGYVGFSAVFSMVLAGLWAGGIHADWAGHARWYALWAFAMLTAGITLGSLWAYYELGWGGFWFWDPVENASLMPWLCGAALVHSLLVLEKRGALSNWTALLALLAFTFSLLGTFLVRSGVLTSVHAFASDPLRGVFILALLVFYAGGGFLLYALKATGGKDGVGFGLVSREMGVLLNNLFLFTFCMTVVTGTLYPVVLDALSLPTVAVGAPYFTKVLLPLFVPFSALMGLVVFAAWGHDKIARLAKHLLPPAVLTALTVLSPVALGAPMRPLGALGLAGGGFILWSTLYAVALKPPRRLAQYAMPLAHAGFALLVLGATVSTQWKQENIGWMSPGDRLRMGGVSLTYLATQPAAREDFNADVAVFSLPDGRRMMPERRWYPAAQKETTESALHFDRLGFVYLTLGDADDDDPQRRVIRAWYHPLVILVFAGGALMALGAGLAVWNRGHGHA